jgi:hypothetical protein
VGPAATDRIQQMIDAEAAERFAPGAVRRLVLLRYGDHPVIEPGELYLLVIPGQDGAAGDAWMAEHFDRLEDFRARRLPEVKGLMVTTGARDSAGLPPRGSCRWTASRCSTRKRRRSRAASPRCRMLSSGPRTWRRWTL